MGYSNAKFYLEYAGFGNLQGIPGKCVDADTGIDAQCGQNTRWISAFIIPDGSSVTSGTTEYLIKALEKNQRMREVNSSFCSTLTLNITYTLPTIDIWVDPSSIGSEPIIVSDPKVIGGILQ